MSAPPADRRSPAPAPVPSAAAAAGATQQDFAGRVALVTGAAHGQGRAVALALAAAGADIAGLDVAAKIEYPGYPQGTSEELASLHAEVEALGRRCLTFAADVRDAAAVHSAVDHTIAALGRIDVLFNNAGIVGYAALDQMTEAEWDAMLDVNLKGPFLVARAVVPAMKRQAEGVIVNNSSVMGLRGGNRLSHYVASKHGLTGLTRAWAIELAPFGIRVVSIHPTGVDTPMNDGLAALEGATAQEIAERSAGNLLPGVPWIETRDVAELVLYLASDRARYATGGQYVIDAGLLTR
jgi:NAD(P)-dependent dehydrogenase (short-subunit alcohol dehydrogenase family)